MTIRPAALLSSTSAVLALACVYELVAPLPAYSVPPVQTSPLPALPNTPAPFTAPLPETYAAISDRPLFDPHRKKYLPSPKPGADKTAPPPPANLSLVGVIIDSNLRIAMVKSSDAMLAMSVGVGAEIGGWQVSSIEPDRIVLKAGTAEEDIRLEANKAPPQAPQQGTAMQPAQTAGHQMGQQQSTP